MRRYPPGWCRWHRTTAQRAEATCAYCGAELHVHKPQLAEAEREGRLHLERCPACHRANAVQRAHGQGFAVRTAQVEAGQPVMQLGLRGISHG